MKVITSVVLSIFSFLPISAALAEEGNPSGISGKDKRCEQSVDMADDMNFADRIVECDEDSVILYDAESRKKFMSRKQLPVKTFEKQQRTGMDATIISEERVHLPGASFIIRERYSLATPHEVLAPLHQQMATYCPLGWELEKQWSRPVGMDYYMHYEFSCADIGD